MKPVSKSILNAKWHWLGFLFMALPFSRAQNFSFFENKIRPLLVEHCYECHSAQSNKLKGGLLLDTRDGLLKGGDTGPGLVPGKPEESLLIRAVRYTDKDLQMPPKDKKLSEAAIADLEAWVKMGAPDPRTNALPALAVKAPPDLTQARKLWAYHKPGAVPSPRVQNGNWPKSEIDLFILAKLEEKKLRPAPPADKRALIRRATFDLIGLPPTPEEVRAFLADNSPDAFAKVVERLLASPHYGERWGRHWLDVVRYTDSFDSRGFGGEGDVPEAYRYRDWVVNAFNSDLPYDQFVTDQIAGDLVALDNSGRFNTNAIVATGVYALGEWGIGDADKEKMLTDIVDDQVDLTGRAFLGMTLACARCHDHKFDPIATRDYYAMAGIFFSSHILPGPGLKTAGSPVSRIPLASPEQIARRKKVEQRIAELTKEIDARTSEAIVSFATNSLSQTSAALGALYGFRNRPSESRLQSLADVARESQLPEPLLRAWSEHLGWGELNVFPKLLKDIAGNAGVYAWRNATGADTPSATVNRTDLTIPITTLTLPPRSVSVHPSPKGGVVVVWKSPIDGDFTVKGRIADGDDQCGDGVEWNLTSKLRGRVGSLAKGAIPNGGAERFGETNRMAFEARRQDSVELTIFPKGGYECDTTIVELQIVESGGQGRTWNLASDIAGDAAEPQNPSPDRFGNLNVWQFADANQLAPTNIPADSPLNRLLVAANALQFTEAAQDLQKQLIEVWTAPVATNNPPAALYKLIADPRSAFWASLRANPIALSGESRKQLDDATSEMSHLKAKLPPAFAVTHGLQEGGTPSTAYEGFHDSPVLARGRYDRPGEIVPRAFPRLLAGDTQPAIAKGSGRLELARWIASADNPLTARVMVNRIWQHHFGEGIVRTPNNYGKLGTPPTHPQLLDYLATKFVRSGWSMKAMHRAMMLSATYQQSSMAAPDVFQADPENLYFGRMNRNRLDAESIRDSLLADSGQLDVSLGGPSIRDLNSDRRTLYITTIRSDRATYQSLFDGADPGRIVENRLNSTVAPQALFLMNNTFALTQAKNLAERARKSETIDESRIQWLYEALYSRLPSEREIDLGRAALTKTGGETLPAEALWERYCQVLLCANEFIYID